MRTLRQVIRSLDQSCNPMIEFPEVNCSWSPEHPSARRIHLATLANTSRDEGNFEEDWSNISSEDNTLWALMDEPVRRLGHPTELILTVHFQDPDGLDFGEDF